MTNELTAEGLRIAHTVQLSKGAQKQLQEEKINAQIEAIIQTVQTGARTARGWKITATHFGLPSVNRLFKKDYNRIGAIEGEYVYRIQFDVECTPKTYRPTFDSEFATIVNAIDGTASQQVRGKWRVTSVDGKPWNAAEAVEKNTSGDVGYAPLQMPDHDEFLSRFSHLYGLDSHISIVESAIRRGIADGFKKRFHTALIGPPGCGKSDICQSVKVAVGEESVLEFDATSTTMAGAQKELSERDELPRVLLVEEIEKAPEQSLAWLLSVLDLRGEIRKTTARQNILRDTRMVAIATVNDYDKFLTLNYGALASRFMNKVHFTRPSRDVMEKIIQREIISSPDGDLAWTKPTLDYMEEAGIQDVREVIAIALCGGNSLLDGSYQAHLRNVRQPNWENGK